MTHAEITHDPSALVPPQSPVPFTLADTPAWLLTPLPALRLAPQDALDDLPRGTLRFTESRGKRLRRAGADVLAVWRDEHAAGRVAAKGEPDGSVRLMRITGGRFEFLTAHAEGAPDREVCERREGQSEFTEERLALGDVVITVRRYPKRYFVALRVAAGPDEAHVVESGGVLERTLHAEYDHRLALARAMVAADDLTGHGPLRERLNRAYAASSPGGLVTLYLLWERWSFRQSLAARHLQPSGPGAGAPSRRLV